MDHPFSRWLVSALVASGLRQTDLRRRLEERGVVVTDSAVSLWAAGRAVPSHRNLGAILDALGAGPEQRLAAMEAAAAPGPGPATAPAALTPDEEILDPSQVVVAP